MSRMNWIDNAKAIGITLVVIGHAGRGFVSSDLITNSEFYWLIDSMIYTFHMPLFFFISGFLLYKQLIKHSKSTLVWSKVNTILYPYVLWTFVQGSIELVMKNYINRTDIDTSVFNILTPHAHLWFLYWLFAFSVFMIFINVFKLNKNIMTFILLILALMSYLFEFGTPYYFSNFIFFLMGYWLADKNIKPTFRKDTFIILSVLFISCQWIYHLNLFYSYESRGVLGLMLSALSIYFVVMLSCIGNNAVVTYIGQCSITIYLMHVILGSGGRIIFQKIFLVENIYTHWLIAVVFGMMIPVAIHYLMSKANNHILIKSSFAS